MAERSWLDRAEDVESDLQELLVDGLSSDTVEHVDAAINELRNAQSAYQRAGSQEDSNG